MTPLTVERFVGGRVAEAKDVLALAQEHGVRMVDFKFTDLPGTWQHLGLSIHALDEEAFTEGLGFDGSSIRGWAAIHASDMLVVPDASTAASRNARSVNSPGCASRAPLSSNVSNTSFAGNTPP